MLVAGTKLFGKATMRKTPLANSRSNSVVTGAVKLLLFGSSLAFTPNSAFLIETAQVRRQSSLIVVVHESQAQQGLAEVCTALDYNPECAMRFKIITCSATSCAQKRKILGLDEYATFSAFFERIEERIPEIQVEETSCLGSCKKAPCVAIEHDEYDGTVALEGMDAFEFSDRVFHRVVEESDAERVWACIENAVQVMSEVGGQSSDS